MAVVFDAGVGSGPFFGNTRTWAHTVGVGDWPFLVAGITNFQHAVTLFTYAGIPMTLMGLAFIGTEKTYMYGLTNPPVGLNNVVVNIGGNAACAVGSISYFGVDPTVPYGAVATNTGNTNNPTVVVAGGAGELVVDMMGWHGTDSVVNIGAGQTQRMAAGSGPGLPGIRSSEELSGPAVTMDWTIVGGAAQWRTVGASLKPLVAARTRAIKYYYDLWGPISAVRDSQAKEVPPDQLRGDTWIEMQGAILPESEIYPSFVEDPSKARIVSVTAKDEDATLKASRSQFADVLIKRAAAGRG